MLSSTQKLAFMIFTLFAVALAAYAWRRLVLRISAGAADTDQRFNQPIQRLWYALSTTLSQRRTFRGRPVVSFFHSLIFYGFVYYLLVNLVDAAEGYLPFSIRSSNPLGLGYNVLADLFSWLVLVGVLALMFRRFALPGRRDFAFNERTLLHPAVKAGAIQRDSLIVSVFILVHVGSRALGAGARLAEEGPDRFQPFATMLSHFFIVGHAHAWRELSYWGALGSVLLFLAYFPRSKHIHIAMAPAKYAVARNVPTGVLPAVVLDRAGDEPRFGASRLEELAWPRLLDAYACIQCNRCQDVCPATATGKALSPSALEINKRMELNELARKLPAFEIGQPSPKPLLTFALSAEAAWACTTCGACLEVCPVQDEPMLDIIDIRRQQVMMEGNFPAQLQTAFRGMERFNNPWAISHNKRTDWAEGLNVPTTDQKPDPDVLFWVGCAASYDPQAQKTARAFVQLLGHAGVDFAVLGKKECCTGDTARRAGNEYLYRQLADKNVATLNELRPKLIVATCPHCMNSVGGEYAQIGGDYKVMHHSQFLESLVAEGKLQVDSGSSTIAFHDPCYLGRHNDVYDAPRNLLKILSNSVVELDRNREKSFCCGAGGAQFWKEEEPGEERISENRYREAQQKLQGAAQGVLAVGCPFCKSMLESTPTHAESSIAVRDIAELLLEGVERKLAREGGKGLTVIAGKAPEPARQPVLPPAVRPAEVAPLPTPAAPVAVTLPDAEVSRRKWVPKPKPPSEPPSEVPESTAASPAEETEAVAAPRKKWPPRPASADATAKLADSPHRESVPAAASEPASTGVPARKKWTPKAPPPAD